MSVTKLPALSKVEVSKCPSVNFKCYILNLETTTKNCSVSLSKDGILVAIEEMNDGSYTHSEHLNPFIDSVLKSAAITFKDLSAVAISKGPGSYTGLRIGVSTAKGLCYALDIPLISVDTMQVLAHQLKINSGFIIPMLDARRMEVYQSVFDANYQALQNTQATIVLEHSFDSWLDKQKVHFIGDAVEKCKTILTHSNAILHPNSFPSAKEMVQLSYAKFINSNFENVAYFEPFYLKDFIALKKV